jgi:arylformamidase
VFVVMRTRQMLLMGPLVCVLGLQCTKAMRSNKSDGYTKTTVAYAAIAGVDPNLLSLDVYDFGANDSLRPVVIYVHGGGWSVGDKANQLEHKKALFYSLGYVFVSVNYRLTPMRDSADPNRIQHPTHTNDVADAVAWLVENIGRYGGDEKNMVLMGHSSGAHLVSLIGTSDDFLPKKNIQLNHIKGIASIDTEGYDVSFQSKAGSKMYLAAFGADSNTWKNASPMFQVKTGTAYAPFFIVKRGQGRRTQMADDFIAKLQVAQTEVTSIDASNYNHMQVNDAIGDPNDSTVTPALVSFLKTCFALPL